MKQNLWLRLMLVALCATVNAQLPACCQTIGNYDETISILSDNLQVNCTNCGSELTSLGNFPNLDSLYNVQLSLTCTNCSYLVTFGNFPSLDSINNYKRNGYGGGNELTLVCNNCTALDSFGMFPESTQLNLDKFIMSCDTCPSITVFGDFAQMTSFTINTLIAFNCSICSSLETLASFPVLSFIDQPFAITCNDCASLVLFGYFPMLYSMPLMVLTCINCGNITTLGNFPAAQYLQLDLTCTECGLLTSIGSFYIPNLISATQITISCNSCQALTTLGNFEANIKTQAAFYDVQLLCNNCPALQILGNFQNTAANALATSQVVLMCTNCPELRTLGNFATITTVSGAITVTCTACATLNTLAYFPLLASVSTNAMMISCSDCSSLGVLGNFTTLTYAYSITLVCENCGSLTLAGFFAAAKTIGATVSCTNCSQIGVLGLFPSASAAAVALHCVSCSALTTLGNFSALSTNTYALTLSCSECDLLENLGYFPILSIMHAAIAITCLDCGKLSSFGNFSMVQSLGTTNISCVSCPSVKTFGNFPMMPSANSLISLVCTQCNELSLFGNYPLLTSIQSNQILMTCNNCETLSTMGNFAALTSLTSPASVYLLCSLCPALSSLLMPSLSINEIASVYLECNYCSSPSFAANEPVNYLFQGSAPLSFSIFQPAAALFLENTPITFSLLSSLSSLTRLANLVFINVSGVPNLDTFIQLVRVDIGIVIQSSNFTNVDGLSNIAYSGSTTIKNNPYLCNVDFAKFEAVSQTPSIVQNNGFNTSCQALMPIAPQQLVSLQRGVTSIQLNWTLPQQPSTSISYTLTMNGVATLTFPAWNPVEVPMTISSLASGQSYTFVLTASLNGAGFSSPALTVTTITGLSTGCLPGQIGSATSHSCAFCGVAQFPSNDLTSCVSCPPGTFSNASGLISSASCELCSPNTYSPLAQSTTCLPCPASAICGLGSAAVEVATTPSLGPTQGTSTVQPNSSSTLAFGYIYLIVFVGAAILALLIVLCFRKITRQPIESLAMLLKTPSFLLKVNLKNGVVNEMPSLLRGIIALWVLIGVIIVTAYQINNFVVNMYGSISSLQPGTTFTSGKVTLTAPTQINVSVSFSASLISCETESLTVSASFGDLSLQTPTCSQATDNTTFMFFTTAGTTLPSSTCLMQLNFESGDGNLVFAREFNYVLTAQRYDMAIYKVSETISGAVTSVLTATTTVLISAVPTELIDIDGDTTGTGYDFSYISSSPGTSSTPSFFLAIAFQLTVPESFLQQRQIQQITPLAFVSGLIAIGGGVVTAGTLIAFFLSKTLFVQAEDKTDVEMHETEDKVEIEMLKTPERFQCSLCPISFESELNYKAHQRHHASAAKRIYNLASKLTDKKASVLAARVTSALSNVNATSQDETKFSVDATETQFLSLFQHDERLVLKTKGTHSTEVTRIYRIEIASDDIVDFCKKKFQITVSKTFGSVIIQGTFKNGNTTATLTVTMKM